MLKIISWNIRQGGGTRINQIIKNIIAEQATIIVLSEFRNNHSGIIIRNALLKNKYRFQLVSAAKSNDNSVLIASQVAFNSLLFPNSDVTYGHSIVEANFSAFRLFGMYLPHKKKHRLFPFLFDELENSAKPAILTGDFNTGINYIDQNGNSFWYEDELKKLNDFGYVDAFRQQNGDVKEYSWYSHQGNPYRYDHFYIHETLIPIVKSCYYIHKWRADGLSDHSPMVLELA